MSELTDEQIDSTCKIIADGMSKLAKLGIIQKPGLTWKDCIGKKVLYRQKGGGGIYGETVRGVTPNGFVRVSAWGDSWIDPKDYELLEVLDEG